MDFGDANSERGADYVHYRKHFLGTLMGTLEGNWLGYEQLMILESPPVKNLLPPQDGVVDFLLRERKCAGDCP
jgi:hypothetical protein